MWNLNLLLADFSTYSKSYYTYWNGYEDNNYSSISNRKLIDFLTSPQSFLENDYPYREKDLSKDIIVYKKNPDFKGWYDSSPSYIPDGPKTVYKYNQNRAFRTIYEVCKGDLMPFKEELCKKIEVYDYREDQMSSTNRVTVYDVVYKVNGETYVWCSVSDMGDKTFEINLVNSSNMFSDLGF